MIRSIKRHSAACYSGHSPRPSRWTVPSLSLVIASRKRITLALILAAGAFCFVWFGLTLLGLSPLTLSLLAAAFGATAAIWEPLLARLRHARAQRGAGASAMIPISDLEELLPGSTAGSVRFEPAGYGFGDTTVQDITLIVLAAQAISARTLFEIGTFRGRTTLNLARNVAEDARIFTLDLDEQEAKAMGLRDRLLAGSDMNLAVDEDNARPCFDDPGIDTAVKQKIERLHGNSTKFDFSPYRRKIDVVFIDGGHTYEVVESDTRKALDMVRPGGLILWHDYDQHWPGLMRSLNDLSKTRKLYHYLGTSLVFYRHESS